MVRMATDWKEQSWLFTRDQQTVEFRISKNKFRLWESEKVIWLGILQISSIDVAFYKPLGHVAYNSKDLTESTSIRQLRQWLTETDTGSQRTRAGRWTWLGNELLTTNSSSVSQSESQEMLLQYFFVEPTSGFVSLEQLVLVSYLFASIFMRQVTVRVCSPRPHDLEQSDQGETYQLWEIKGPGSVMWSQICQCKLSF